MPKKLLGLLFIVLMIIVALPKDVNADTRLSIPHRFSAYESPSFTSTEVATFAAQTVTVVRKQGDYWHLIETSRYGQKWVYYNPNLVDTKSFDYRFNGYKQPSFQSERVSSFSPQTVKVIAQDKNWYQFETANNGNIWVYDGRLTIPHRFSAYDSPSFSSNEVAQFSGQRVRIVSKQGKYWHEIVTSKYGNKWVYYNPDLETLSIPYRFDGHESPSSSSPRVSSFSSQTINVIAKHGNWYQFETSKFGNLWTYYDGTIPNTQSFIVPLDSNKYRITSRYGQRSSGFHYGIDLAQSGTVRIISAADGVVTRSGWSDSYGFVVYVRHNIKGSTFTTVYAHMRNTPNVAVGQTVKQGQLLGYMGNTGNSSGQHLHFEIHRGEWSSRGGINPEQFIDF
nr:M23 family metallopeptidase [Amphibacillus sediminis]